VLLGTGPDGQDEDVAVLLTANEDALKLTITALNSSGWRNQLGAMFAWYWQI